MSAGSALLMHRARAGQATAQEQHLLPRNAPARTPPAPHSGPREQKEELSTAATGPGEDSLDDLDQDQDAQGTAEDENGSLNGPAVPVAEHGLDDARAEALKW
ncbi:hypothetical protein OOK13_01310 [Streptomyces sp. NBC_00378]|uniref:hypothetical protein n=1 Tax=unclassified Streptomyces TaxID=2593676 RepID=UPI0022545912|nr:MULTISPECIES: hypothetical protein [unclassified Streptomyces]MCX5107200.1 hypothetical protein [Streptomyces sp. NBC_00378]